MLNNESHLFFVTHWGHIISLILSYMLTISVMSPNSSSFPEIWGVLKYQTNSNRWKTIQLWFSKWYYFVLNQNTNDIWFLISHQIRSGEMPQQNCVIATFVRYGNFEAGIWRCVRRVLGRGCTSSSRQLPKQCSHRKTQPPPLSLPITCFWRNTKKGSWDLQIPFKLNYIMIAVNISERIVVAFHAKEKKNLI